jgi:Tol biopolymer transport system component
MPFLQRKNAGAVRIALMLCCAAAVAAGGSAGSARAIAGAARNGSIVFERFDPNAGVTRLYVVQADGRGLHPLGGQAQAPDSQADWSPDARRIVFRRFVDAGLGDERAQIFVIGADGRGLRNLTAAGCKGACMANEEPAWSPDGKRIAFVRTLGAPPPAKPRAVGVFVMNADGTHVRQLTQRKGTFHTEDRAPSWSPDGKRIAFMSANTTFRPPGASTIYVINADGTHPRTVRALPHAWPGGGAPSWSPDGKRLLYSTYCWFGNCGQPAVGAQLYTVGVDGKSPRQLTRLAGNALDPRWSPDGKKIVFVRNARVGPGGDVYTIGADGKGMQRLTTAPDLGARSPDWGPAPPAR